MSRKQKVNFYDDLAGLDTANRFVSKYGFSSGKAAFGVEDDFTGNALDTAKWNYLEGTDTATAGNAISSAAGGVLRITAGDSAGSVAADGAALTGGLAYAAVNGGLTFEARFKLPVITNASVFIGFSDTKALEAPVISAGSANTITTNATDAVGILFDTAMTADTWWLVGVATDVDATAQNTGVAPVADTYETWRIEVSVAGVATFYRNGVAIGSAMAGAVTPAAILTPYAIVWPRTAEAGKIIDLDWIEVSNYR